MAQFDGRVQMSVPSPKRLFTPAVTAVIVLMVTGFALLSHAPNFTVKWLALSADGVLQGRVWQLLTYTFVSNPGPLVFNALLVLFVGSSVEREWGTGQFALLWLVVAVTCGAVWMIVDLLVEGSLVGTDASACCFGLIAVFGILFRGRYFLAMFWTIKAQHISWGLIAIGLVLGIQNLITWIWVGGAAVGYAYASFRAIIASSGTAGPVSSDGRGGGFVDID